MTDLADIGCPECGRVYQRAAKMAAHIAAIPNLCDQTTRFWRRKHGIARVELHPQEVKVRPVPEPGNPWAYWQLQLAGQEPDDRAGPYWGFFSLREWISPEPPERKKIPVDRPVAIWSGDDDWHCLITRGWGVAHLTGVMNAHEIFSRCCRDPLTHEDYLAQVQELEHEPCND